MRALHRDLGYMIVGLVVVNALSGTAVNHVADQDPNFVSFKRTHEWGPGLAGTDDEIADTFAAGLVVLAPVARGSNEEVPCSCSPVS